MTESLRSLSNVRLLYDMWFNAVKRICHQFGELSALLYTLILYICFYVILQKQSTFGLSHRGRRNWPRGFVTNLGELSAISVSYQFRIMKSRKWETSIYIYREKYTMSPHYVCFAKYQKSLWPASTILMTLSWLFRAFSWNALQGVRK